MNLEATFTSDFMLDFLKTHSVQEWNYWIQRLVDLNLVCSVWREGKRHPIVLTFDFQGADLSNRQLDQLDFSQCDLACANFSRASVRGAVFRWMPAAVFVGADLRDAQIVSGEISAVDFTGACLAGIVFDDVRYNALMPPKGLPNDLMRCCIAEVEDD
jgi:uncharacterized protein YjbI with pentapeptide repeats